MQLVDVSMYKHGRQGGKFAEADYRGGNHENTLKANRAINKQIMKLLQKGHLQTTRWKKQNLLSEIAY